MASTVLFVCEHGALRSRIAAAFFNAAAPKGWRAASAGRAPQSDLSRELVPLLAGTAAAAHLEADPPRPLAAFIAPDRVIAIDCAVAGAERWDLEARSGSEIRDEIRARVENLVRHIEVAG